MLKKKSVIVLFILFISCAKAIEEDAPRLIDSTSQNIVNTNGDNQNNSTQNNSTQNNTTTLDEPVDVNIIGNGAYEYKGQETINSTNWYLYKFIPAEGYDLKGFGSTDIKSCCIAHSSSDIRDFNFHLKIKENTINEIEVIFGEFDDEGMTIRDSYYDVDNENSVIIYKKHMVGFYTGTTYRDGTPIPQVTDPVEWSNLTTGAWCYVNNDPSTEEYFGKLYNWYAIVGKHDNDPNTPNKKFSKNASWMVPINSPGSRFNQELLINSLGWQTPYYTSLLSPEYFHNPQNPNFTSECLSSVDEYNAQIIKTNRVCADQFMFGLSGERDVNGDFLNSRLPTERISQNLISVDYVKIWKGIDAFQALEKEYYPEQEVDYFKIRDLQNIEEPTDSYYKDYWNDYTIQTIDTNDKNLGLPVYMVYKPSGYGSEFININQISVVTLKK